MNKLHEAGAALGFGLVSYGLMHLLPPPDQEIQHHAVAVDMCSREMGGAGRYTDDLPPACGDFEAQLDTGSLLSFRAGEGEGTGRYYLPPYDTFVAEASYTPDQINAKYDMYATDAYVIGFCAAVSAFGIIRWRAYIKEEGKEQSVASKAPKPPRPQRPKAVPNEDSPLWLEYCREHGY